MRTGGRFKRDGSVAAATDRVTGAAHNFEACEPEDAAACEGVAAQVVDDGFRLVLIRLGLNHRGAARLLDRCAQSSLH
jgi:hypothetical protein